MERIGHRHALQLLPAFAPEGSAGGRQNEALDLAPVLTALEALENGRVLRVHRYDIHPAAVGLVHDQLAGADQRLLIGKGDALTGMDGRQRGTQTHDTHHCRDHRIRGRQRGRFHQALHAGGHPDGGIRQRKAQLFRRLGVHHDRKLGLELAALRFHPGHVPVGRQRHRAKAAGGNHVQRLTANGAGGAQN